MAHASLKVVLVDFAVCVCFVVVVVIIICVVIEEPRSKLIHKQQATDSTGLKLRVRFQETCSQSELRKFCDGGTKLCWECLYTMKARDMVVRPGDLAGTAALRTSRCRLPVLRPVLLQRRICCFSSENVFSLTHVAGGELYRSSSGPRGSRRVFLIF